VKATALAHIEQIVLDFTRQESPNAAVECKIRTAIMDFVWSATMGVRIQLGSLQHISPLWGFMFYARFQIEAN